MIIVIQHVQFYIYRLYKVKQTRKAMSEDVEVHRLPAGYHGAYRPFKKCLVSVLADEVHNCYGELYSTLIIDCCLNLYSLRSQSQMI